jgi:tetratricopeptide (TPR) repeat protein
MLNYSVSRLICICMLCSCFVLAQTRKADSLKQLLVIAEEDTSRLNLLNDIAYQLMGEGQPDSAIAYAGEAIRFSGTIKESLTVKKAKARSYNIAGSIYLLVGDYENALKNFFVSLDLRKAINDKAGMGSSYNNIGSAYYNRGEYEEALKYHLLGLRAREEANDRPGISTSYNNIGLIYWKQTLYSEAQKTFQKALKFKEELGDKKGIANVYSNIANVFFEQANYPEALKGYFNALRVKEGLGEDKGLANLYNNIGSVYYQIGNMQDALKNYQRALQIRKNLGDKMGIAGSYDNLGALYRKMQKYDKAMESLNTSLELYRELDHKYGIAECYDNIAAVLADQGKYNEAVENLRIALKIEEEDGDKHLICGILINLGGISSRLKGELKKSEEYTLRGVKLAEEIGDLEQVKLGRETLSEVYSLMGKPKEALENYKSFIAVRDSMINEENTKKTVRLEMNYEFEKKEAAEKIGQEKKEVVAAAERKKQNIIIWCICGVLLIVMVFAAYAYRSYLQKRKANEAISRQKHIIEEKQKEILDSIHYAKRIQTALITSEKYISRNLNKLNSRA